MIDHIITSTVLVITILLLSALLEKRIDPCIKYALWFLVAVKLLIPLPAFETRMSILNVVNQKFLSEPIRANCLFLKRQESARPVWPESFFRQFI